MISISQKKRLITVWMNDRRNSGITRDVKEESFYRNFVFKTAARRHEGFVYP